MLYWYGVQLGMKLALRGKLKSSLKYTVVPVNYWRTIEYRLVWAAAGFVPGDRVLDIGSPKLLSLYLADKKRVEVHATDIEGYFIPEYHLLRRLQGIAPQQYHLRTEDGRRLSYPDAFFTKVFSISVLEHIPGDGDTDCAREIGRVLHPGGRCVITVPFARTFREEYADPRFYWHRSSAAGENGKVFYQRRYGERDLFARLIGPSGLRLRTLRYVGERVLTHSNRELCEYLPRPTGPVQPLLSHLLHTPARDSWRELKKPLCALIVLEK